MGGQCPPHAPGDTCVCCPVLPSSTAAACPAVWWYVEGPASLCRTLPCPAACTALNGVIAATIYEFSKVDKRECTRFGRDISLACTAYLEAPAAALAGVPAVTRPAAEAFSSAQRHPVSQHRAACRLLPPSYGCFPACSGCPADAAIPGLEHLCHGKHWCQGEPARCCLVSRASCCAAAALRLRQLLRRVRCSWHAAGHRTRRLPARCALLLPQL